MGAAYLSGTAQDQPVAGAQLETKRVLMVLAEGFEDSEAVTVLDVFGWTRYRPKATTVEVEIGGFKSTAHGAFGAAFDVDVLVKDARPDCYDALVIPGGFHNLGYDEMYCDDAHALVRAFHNAKKPIATMCVGVLPVAESGVLKGCEATTYSLSSRHDNRARLEDAGCVALDEPVVDSNGVISCSGPAYSQEVAMRLLASVAGAETAAEVSRYRNGLR